VAKRRERKGERWPQKTKGRRRVITARGEGGLNLIAPSMEMRESVTSMLASRQTNNEEGIHNIAINEH